MSDGTDATAGKTVRAASPDSEWRRRRLKTRIDKDVAQRQGSLSTIAFLTLGKEGALAFLNTDNREVGGKPIEIGSNSAEGAARVREVLRGMAADLPRD